MGFGADRSGFKFWLCHLELTESQFPNLWNSVTVTRIKFKQNVLYSLACKKEAVSPYLLCSTQN